MRLRNKVLIGSLLVASVLGSVSGAVFAKTPPKNKELVYGMNLYQGKGFSGTFLPRVEHSVSIAANRGNVVSPKVTLVYYWPITGEYMADWETMNQTVGGRLQILKDDKVIKTLDKIDVGFHYPNGPYDDVATLLKKGESRKEFKDYQKVTEDYYAAQSKYYQDKQAYEDAITKLLDEQQQGKKIDPKKIPKSPAEPKPPTWYVTEPYQAFVVDLPKGNYVMRLVSKDGSVLKDSTKKLRVVEPRSNGVGYDVSTEQKYPTSLRADQPNNSIYYTGNKVMFFNPFKAEEFTQYDFLKITKLHMPSSNNAAKDAWTWVYGDPISDATIQVVRDGKVVYSAKEQPFYIEQSGTDTARRNIVVYKESNYSGQQGQSQPHFRAMRVEVKKAPNQWVRLVDKNGKVIPGSERELRSISGRNPMALLYAAFAPLVIGLALIIGRRLTTSTKA